GSGRTAPAPAAAPARAGPRCRRAPPGGRSAGSSPRSAARWTGPSGARRLGRAAPPPRARPAPAPRTGRTAPPPAAGPRSTCRCRSARPRRTAGTAGRGGRGRRSGSAAPARRPPVPVRRRTRRSPGRSAGSIEQVLQEALLPAAPVGAGRVGGAAPVRARRVGVAAAVAAGGVRVAAPVAARRVGVAAVVPRVRGVADRRGVGRGSGAVVALLRGDDLLEFTPVQEDPGAALALLELDPLAGHGQQASLALWAYHADIVCEAPWPWSQTVDGALSIRRRNRYGTSGNPSGWGFSCN